MTADVPVHVATGFTWTAALVGLLNLLVGGALVAAIKNWPKLKELGNARRKDEIDTMGDRITMLEGKLEEERAKCDADLAVMRHRMNNLSACLDAILLLIEAAPDKAAEHVVKIRAMRERQEQTEAAEKASIHVAKITAKTV